MSNTDAGVNNQIFRKDNPMILAGRRDLASFVPVRLAYNASGYVSGQALGLNSVSGQWQNYNDAGASGINTCVGILFDAIDVSEFPSTTGTVAARMITGGELFNDKLTGMDANGRTDLGARIVVDATGTNILKF